MIEKVLFLCENKEVAENSYNGIAVEKGSMLVVGVFHLPDISIVGKTTIYLGEKIVKGSAFAAGLKAEDWASEYEVHSIKTIFNDDKEYSISNSVMVYLVKIG